MKRDCTTRFFYTAKHSFVMAGQLVCSFVCRADASRRARRRTRTACPPRSRFPSCAGPHHKELGCLTS
ncbi:hypothetical protein BLAT2472_20698 [Burkholderia latens]